MVATLLQINEKKGLLEKSPGFAYAIQLKMTG
jgi:hypothetical protein